MLSAKIIADSEFNGQRLVTFEVEFWRPMLPELNTHRVFSRNYQSSRAVPIKALIEQVKHNPAMPVYWGRNKAGMVAGDELTGKEKEMAKIAWLNSAEDAADNAEAMDNLGIHKQLVNRVLEPFMWTKGVITATSTGLEGFFKLRCHPDAQPEIAALAELMRDAMILSEPTALRNSEWHTPYFENGYWCHESETSLEEAIKVSTSCVAQVSYRRLDDSLEKAEKIYDMLNLPANGVFSENPPHFSPAEHCAMAVGESDYMDDLIHLDESDMGGNFNTVSFYQYRKMLEQGVEMDYIT